MPPRRVHDLLQVGPILAERILQELGGPRRSHRQALEVIANDPDRLLAVQAIGKPLRDAIVRANNFDHIRKCRRRGPPPQRSENPSRDATSDKAGDATPEHTPPPARKQAQGGRGERLRLSGLSASQLALARKHFGGDDPEQADRVTLDTVRRDPYRLLEIPGVHYRAASRIAVEVAEVSADHHAHNLHANRDILERAGGVLPLRKFLAERHRRRLPESDELMRLGIVVDYGLAWTEEEHAAELEVHGWLDGHEAPATSDFEISFTPVDEDILRKKHGLNDDQTSFVKAALSTRLSFLTGGAGTGKTITVTALIDLVRRRGFNAHVLTLAGKSAERVAQACRRRDIRITEANEYGLAVDDDDTRRHRAAGMVHVTTIHRGLRADGSGQFAIRELAADFIIIDEASMVPNKLLASILQRSRPSAHVVLAGDPAQLPPIQHGRPFEDALRRLPAGARWIHLVQNYRQADQESIHLFATALRERGKPPFLRAPGLTVHLEHTPEEAIAVILGELERTPHALLDWQAITSTNRVRVVLNEALQAHINPDGKAVAHVRDGTRTTPLRKGDKIVVIRNDYATGIMNGQTGLLEDTGSEGGSVRALIEGRRLELPSHLVDSHIRLGYVITVHKAQGSGWPAVFSVEGGPVWAYANRLYYTAVTRAERSATLITSLDRAGWWDNATALEPARQSTLLARRRSGENKNPHTAP